MKNPLASLKMRLPDLKGRTLLIVIGGVLILVMLIMFIFKPSQDITGTTPSGASTVRAPRLQSTPGVSKVNDQSYVELQRQANLQKAQTAIQGGNSAVATVTSDQYVNELSIPEPGIASVQGRNGVIAQTTADQQKRENASLEQYQRTYQDQIKREQVREQERIMQEQSKQQDANQEAYESLMQSQAKNLLGQWQPQSQAYVHGTIPSGSENGAPIKGSGPLPMYKAGDIIFGIMETSVNSDEPGPVMVKVVSGPLVGSKLIGSFRRVDDQVFLEFTLLNDPNAAHSVPVKAVAIDPETARTALASDVDYHRLLRYGTLFASAFLQGMGEAVLAGIQPDFTVDGSTFTVNNVSTTTKDQVLVGIGEVGTKLGDKLDPIFNTPPTVTVDSGTAVGLLFLQDFVLNPEPNSATASPARPIQIVEERSAQAGSGLMNANLSKIPTTTSTTSTNNTVTSQ